MPTIYFAVDFHNRFYRRRRSRAAAAAVAGAIVVIFIQQTVTMATEMAMSMTVTTIILCSIIYLVTFIKTSFINIIETKRKYVYVWCAVCIVLKQKAKSRTVVYILFWPINTNCLLVTSTNRFC